MEGQIDRQSSRWIRDPSPIQRPFIAKHARLEFIVLDIQSHKLIKAALFYDHRSVLSASRVEGIYAVGVGSAAQWLLIAYGPLRLNNRPAPLPMGGNSVRRSPSQV
jgi:hypothetical protein